MRGSVPTRDGEPCEGSVEKRYSAISLLIREIGRVMEYGYILPYCRLWTQGVVRGIRVCLCT